MRGFLAGLTTAAIAWSGCGGSDEKTADKQRSTTAAAGQCSNGTKSVTAKELVPNPAPGYSLAPSDPAAIKTIVTQFKTALGDRWRGHDAKVLARDGASHGTLLLVVNSTEKLGGNDDIVSGMLKKANESGYKTEPITVRGEETRLARTADDTYVTVAAAGECAAVTVISTSEKELRDAVKQID